MTPPLSLFLSFSCFLSPVPPLLSPPHHPPWVDQTQTQLEHARIGELEQNLLLEKAQAERLLRELADNRVTARRLRPASAFARQPVPSASLFYYFLSLATLLFGFFFTLCPF